MFAHKLSIHNWIESFNYIPNNSYNCLNPVYAEFEQVILV